MNKAKEHLDKVLEGDIDFEITDVVRNGFAIYRQAASKFVFFVILYILMGVTASMIPYIGQVIQTVVIAPALTIGSIYFCFLLTKNQNPEFGVFFTAFKEYKNFISANIVILILTSLCLIPLGTEIIELQKIIATGSPDSIEEIQDYLVSISKVKILISIIGATLIYLFTLYTNYFIAVFRLDSMSALRYSFKFMAKKFFILIIFNIAMMAFFTGGFFLFCIGMIFAYAILVPIYYSSFLELTDYEKFSGQLLNARMLEENFIKPPSNLKS